MSHVRHELAEEFPEKTDQLHDLKITDPGFAELADNYHVVNRKIHRIETGVEAASDLRWEDLKKHRLALIDEIYGRLTKN